MQVQRINRVRNTRKREDVLIIRNLLLPIIIFVVKLIIILLVERSMIPNILNIM